MTRRFPDGVAVSALTGDGLADLLDRLARRLPHPPIEVTLLVPFERPEVVPSLYRNGEVLATEDRADGTWVVARVAPADFHKVEGFVVEPASKRSRA